MFLDKLNIHDIANKTSANINCNLLYDDNIDVSVDSNNDAVAHNNTYPRYTHPKT